MVLFRWLQAGIVRTILEPQTFWQAYFSHPPENLEGLLRPFQFCFLDATIEDVRVHARIATVRTMPSLVRAELRLQSEVGHVLDEVPILEPLLGFFQNLKSFILEPRHDFRRVLAFESRGIVRPAPVKIVTTEHLGESIAQR